MNDKIKYLAGILVFGSLWGFSECIIGPQLSNIGISSGAIMTGFFAMIFLTMSRLIFKRKGMQLGMGLVAGSMRYFNPFGGCQVCSAISIAAEGLVLELIFDYLINVDLNQIKSLTSKVALGVFSAYSVFVIGYIITQILTPLSYGLFYIENLISFIPTILAEGLIVALFGALVFPLTIEIYKLDMKIPDKLYYPTTVGISLFCWISVIGTWIILS